MKLNLAIVALALAIPTASYAQMDSTAMYQGEYPNTYSSGSANVSPFTQSSKRFNDWSISVGAGVPLLQKAELQSIKNGDAQGGKDLYGYSAYVSIDKAITHAFGLKLQYDRGETRQGFFNTKTDNATPTMPIGARTQYDAISILGDINLSNVLRRVDNKSPFRWAFHGYAGLGTLAYKSYVEDMAGQRLVYEAKAFEPGFSWFGQGGAGLKYKLNNRLDIEGRAMYVYTVDDTFDGYRVPSDTSDDFFNVTLGLTMNLGKHESHLMWHDPLQEIYYKLDVLAENNQDVEVCKSGDNDNDGVCDDWDRQLDTPTGARVDGAGVALDVDLDGVIDLYDKCVTVPGPVENDGCPTVSAYVPSTGGTVIGTDTQLDGIEFDLNSDRILPSNTPILNNAVSYINSTDGGSYKVIGATDTRASDAYNQKLSERRANSVKSYLIQNGVNSEKLQAEGRGEKDLKYPECEPATKCPEWKNRANRRVFFEAK